MLYPVLELL
jgi:hypothetical protein